jgi:hypothetical protein
MTETTILDFRLSNTFEEFRDHMNTTEKQAMFSQMGLNAFVSDHIEMIQVDQQ